MHHECSSKFCVTRTCLLERHTCKSQKKSVTIEDEFLAADPANRPRRKIIVDVPRKTGAIRA